jgi:hypothetical protein
MTARTTAAVAVFSFATFAGAPACSRFAALRLMLRWIAQHRPDAELDSPAT